MTQRAKAYNGKEPFVFASYCHTDGDRVYPIINSLVEAGCRIWYDEGIMPSEEWRGTINRRILDCGLFMIFVTKKSMASHEVIKECSFAINLKKRLHIIYLEDVPSSDIDESLLADFTNSQCVFAHRLHSEVFEQKLYAPLDKFMSGERKKAEPKPSEQVQTKQPRLAAAGDILCRAWESTKKPNQKAIKTLAWIIFALCAPALLLSPLLFGGAGLIIMLPMVWCVLCSLATLTFVGKVDRISGDEGKLRSALNVSGSLAKAAFILLFLPALVFGILLLDVLAYTGTVDVQIGIAAFLLIIIAAIYSTVMFIGLHNRLRKVIKGAALYTDILEEHKKKFKTALIVFSVLMAVSYIARLSEAIFHAITDYNYFVYAGFATEISVATLITAIIALSFFLLVRGEYVLCSLVENVLKESRE